MAAEAAEGAWDGLLRLDARESDWEGLARAMGLNLFQRQVLARMPPSIEPESVRMAREILEVQDGAYAVLGCDRGDIADTVRSVYYQR